MGDMKAHGQFATAGFPWEHEPSLSLGCKRLRPLALRLPNSNSISSFDLKSFIKGEIDPAKLDFTDDNRNLPRFDQIDTNHVGGTRWNPTQEQIGLLEMMYRGGIRTPNSREIEEIASKLAKYGKIEGKNVFYWFQNHKARERQKLRRTCIAFENRAQVGIDKQDFSRKRKCIDEHEDGTLELFPLHPQS